MASAVPFITSDGAKLAIDAGAAKWLSTLKNVCPVIICGPYRSGKSAILNLLLRCERARTQGEVSLQGGFQVGGTVQACTKGIWLYNQAFFDKESGRTLVFFDSEGLGSLEKQATFDAHIFALSLLLGSVFVLNTSGPINENALEQLDLVVQMTRMLRAGDSKSSSRRSSVQSEVEDDSLDEQNAKDLVDYMPEFLWTLRDFSLDLQDASGRALSSDAYLEHALAEQPAPEKFNSAKQRRAFEEKNRIRSALRLCFPKRLVANSCSCLSLTLVFS